MSHDHEDDDRRPIDDPLPEHSPVIDEPGREIPVVDPSRPDLPRPVRDPQPPPGNEAGARGVPSTR